MAGQSHFKCKYLFLETLAHLTRVSMRRMGRAKIHCNRNGTFLRHASTGPVMSALINRITLPVRISIKGKHT